MDISIYIRNKLWKRLIKILTTDVDVEYPSSAKDVAAADDDCFTVSAMVFWQTEPPSLMRTSCKCLVILGFLMWFWDGTSMWHQTLELFYCKRNWKKMPNTTWRKISTYLIWNDTFHEYGRVIMRSNSPFCHNVWRLCMKKRKFNFWFSLSRQGIAKEEQPDWKMRNLK